MAMGTGLSAETYCPLATDAFLPRSELHKNTAQTCSPKFKTNAQEIQSLSHDWKDSE